MNVTLKKVRFQISDKRSVRLYIIPCFNVFRVLTVPLISICGSSIFHRVTWFDFFAFLQTLIWSLLAGKNWLTFCQNKFSDVFLKKLIPMFSNRGGVIIPIELYRDGADSPWGFRWQFNKDVQARKLHNQFWEVNLKSNRNFDTPVLVMLVAQRAYSKNFMHLVILSAKIQK